MNDGNKYSSSKVMKPVESDILKALKQLETRGYDVRSQVGQLDIEFGGAAKWYEPDFIVVSPDGKRLIVEVKSQRSLSLENIAKLMVIARQAKAAGDRLLVFVPDAGASHTASRFTDNADGLKISYANSPTKVVPAVIEALSGALEKAN